jgi:phage gp29-like protein
MDKRTRERLEREKLNLMIAENPRLKAFLDTCVDDTGNKELKDLIEPVLKDTFDKVRLQGVQTGWYAHAARCVAKIKDCKTIDEAVEILNEDVKTAQEKLGIKEGEDG